MLLSVWRFAKFGAVRVLVNLYIPRRFGKIASGRTCFARFKSKLLGVRRVSPRTYGFKRLPRESVDGGLVLFTFDRKRLVL